MHSAPNVIAFDAAQSLESSAKQNSTLQQELAAGYKNFDQFQYRDALKNFANVLCVEPNNRDAQIGYNLVVQKIVPRWHFSMMNDYQRNDAFEAAIERVVKDKVVLDVGSGAGLLAMMAARAGAKKVYTCEMNETVADFARIIVAANGYADKITVIGKKSNDLVVGEDMAEKAEVLVTETLDSALLGEGMVPIINDAKGRLLVDDAAIIPSRATLYFALLNAQEVWEMNHAKLVSGFDVSLFNHLSSDGFYPVRLKLFEHAFLSSPTELCRFDFVNDELRPRQFEIPLTVTQDGRCHAVAYWLDLHLDDKTMFSTTPDNLDSHWKQAVQCFPEPLTLTAGQQWVLSVNQGLTRFDFGLTPSR